MQHVEQPGGVVAADAVVVAQVDHVLESSPTVVLVEVAVVVAVVAVAEAELVSMLQNFLRS